MKTKLSLLLLLITGMMLAQKDFNYQRDFKTILAKTKDAADPLAYNSLLKRFQTNDTSLSNYEVLSLLIGFTAQPAYKPYSDLHMERKIYSLNGDGKYAEALDSATKFLGTHPLSLKTLYEKSYAFYKLGKTDSSEYYMYEGKRILQAMHYTGDGRTPETAIFALGPADGQEYIHKSGGSIGIMGDGRDKNGNFLDILEAKTKDGSSFRLYFNIQHAAAKMFEGTDLEEELKKSEEKDKKTKSK